MNIEALEKDGTYCSVRETNGTVRVLEKKNKNCTFKEIFDLENKIEDLNTTIELLFYNIDNIRKKNNDKKYFYLLEVILLPLIIYVFKFTSFSNICLFTVFFQLTNIALTGIFSLNKKKIDNLISEINSFVEENEELKEQLHKIKEQAKIQEYVAIDSKISDEDVNSILHPAFHNRVVGNVYNLYSMKILRYELIRYLANKKKLEDLEEDIDEIDIEYPGIPKILKKNRG